jgi:hypothetical protein
VILIEFVASSHKICGEEGSPILWLLIVPTYHAHLQLPKLCSPPLQEATRSSVLTHTKVVCLLQLCDRKS